MIASDNAERTADEMLAEVLQGVRELLAESSRWTRRTLARTLLDQPVLPLSEAAWRWSVTGALARAIFDVLGPNAAQRDWQHLYDRGLNVLWQSLPAEYRVSPRLSLDLDAFNDHPGTYYDDIVELLDRAQV